MISFFEIQDSYETEISGKSFLFVHGHKLDPENMPKKDFTFGGHTHCYVIIEYNGITTYINPGSLGLPKNSKFPTFAVIEDNKITIRKLDGTILETKEF
jgi:predicted phosphodiesterase